MIVSDVMLQRLPAFQANRKLLTVTMTSFS